MVESEISPVLELKMIIRREVESDAEMIIEVTKSAFENHPYSNQTEHFIVNALRAANALTISLVAEVGGRVVGHIAFSPVAVSDGGQDWYGVGPYRCCRNTRNEAQEDLSSRRVCPC